MSQKVTVNDLFHAQLFMETLTVTGISVLTLFKPGISLMFHPDTKALRCGNWCLFTHTHPPPPTYCTYNVYTHTHCTDEM